MLCDSCDKKDLCQQLCPEAELSINQDYVVQRELTVTEMDGHGKMIRKMPEYVGVRYYTTAERAVLDAFGRGLSRPEVCQLLDITISTLRSHVQNIRAKRLDHYIN